MIYFNMIKCYDYLSICYLVKQVMIEADSKIIDI